MVAKESVVVEEVEDVLLIAAEVEEVDEDKEEEEVEVEVKVVEEVEEEEEEAEVEEEVEDVVEMRLELEVVVAPNIAWNELLAPSDPPKRLSASKGST